MHHPMHVLDAPGSNFESGVKLCLRLNPTILKKVKEAKNLNTSSEKPRFLLSLFSLLVAYGSSIHVP